jgi:hypothetical protein
MIAVGVGVGVAAAGVAGSALSASAQGKAAGKAGAAQAAAYADTKAALQQANKQARNDYQPYADAGRNALNELNWQMGLPTGSTAKTYTAADAPNVVSSNTGDKFWDDMVASGQASHAARYGAPMSASANEAGSWLNDWAQSWADAKNKEAQANAGTFQGAGTKGGLMANYTPEQYKQDPGYTPMVNDLASLQATPGYQFQLEQGLQSVNNSAAANGSLLSGRQLKAVNDYAQGQASTGYQAAWDRAQQAYQNAFNRDTTNKTNNYSKLQSMANNGQSAAGGQANAAITTGSALAGAATNNGNNQAGLAMAQGQIQANMYTGMANAVKSGVSAGYGVSGGGGGTGFNLLGQQDNNTGSAGTNNGMVNGATNRFFGG